MGDTNKDLEDLAKSTTEDFYELLGVSFESDEAAIKKAYRKASIKYHPDKNPDNKDAADRFIYLGWARDILMDEKLKGEYDRARTRRREKAMQDEMLDGRRRKMKDDLERREREFKQGPVNPLKRKATDLMSEEEKLEQKVRRLAEDSRRRMKELNERREKERKEEEEASFMDMEKSPEPQPSKPGDSAQLDRAAKVRFSREGDSTTWDKDTISTMFSRYGKIDCVVMGKDKKIRPSGSKHRKTIATAFVIYTRMDHAHAAVMDAKSHFPALESVAWANGEPEIKSPANNDAPTAPSTPVATPNKSFRASWGPGMSKGMGTPKFSFSPKTPSLEEVTMMRLKQAEKKRLEEKIRREEAAAEAAGADT
jgi:DnaJ family protein C protein 17